MCQLPFPRGTGDSVLRSDCTTQGGGGYAKLLGFAIVAIQIIQLLLCLYAQPAAFCL